MAVEEPQECHRAGLTPPPLCMALVGMFFSVMGSALMRRVSESGGGSGGGDFGVLIAFVVGGCCGLSFASMPPSPWGGGGERVTQTRRQKESALTDPRCQNQIYIHSCKDTVSNGLSCLDPRRRGTS